MNRRGVIGNIAVSKTAVLRSLLGACAIFLPVAVSATDIPGPVTAEVLSVYDGDTITVLANPWPDSYYKVKVRIRGIDAPEIKGKCEAEKKKAIEAREFLWIMVKHIEEVTLTNIEHDKYGGRFDADVNINGVDAAQALISQGLARPYTGGERKGWCNG